jgi:hypothetical protein
VYGGHHDFHGDEEIGGLHYFPTELSKGVKARLINKSEPCLHCEPRILDLVALVVGATANLIDVTTLMASLYESCRLEVEFPRKSQISYFHLFDVHMNWFSVTVLLHSCDKKWDKSKFREMSSLPTAPLVFFEFEPTQTTDYICKIL